MLSNTSIKTFNIRDIDPSALKNRAKAECDQICNSANAKQGRSYSQVLVNCMQGHAAELWLLKHNYKDNSKKYMDVIDPDDITVDVKAFMDLNENYTQTAIRNNMERCRKKKINSLTSTNGYEFADQVYLYLIDPKDGTYALKDIYKWDGTKFDK